MDEEDDEEDAARRPLFTAGARMNLSIVRLKKWQKRQEHDHEPLLEVGWFSWAQKTELPAIPRNTLQRPYMGYISLA
jgi:hypothetical protein